MKITTHIVEEKNRKDFLPKYFGAIARAIIIEGMIYSCAGKMISGYNGGAWVFKTCSNGAAYITPEYDGSRNITMAENYYEGNMSADAAGLAITTLVVNSMTAKYQDHSLYALWEKLMDVVASHPERKELYKFLD